MGGLTGSIPYHFTRFYTLFTFTVQNVKCELYIYGMLPILNNNYIAAHPETGITADYQGYPEKILQFGTGVLLRGLVDFLVDKANKQGIFRGRVVVVKSTSGDTADFATQDHLYTTHIKGVSQGELIDIQLINASLSRVLQSNAEWGEILKAALQADMRVIVSNTTEVGIQYVPEDITRGVPASFPGKLLAILWEKYRQQGEAATGYVIVPTELVVNNGQLLRETVLQLAAFNNLPAPFIHWVETANQFCNSLVDRIVPGKPADLAHQETKAGYRDRLWINAEPFLLWAIEGDDTTREAMSFYQADDRMLIAPSITPFREQKLRILNGSHTIAVPLAYLSGCNTVAECMEHAFIRHFFEQVILTEILPTIRAICPQADNFARDVLDRFANPFIAHQLLNITFQESSKMNARNVQTFFRYHEQNGELPPYMCMGFAAMLLFMKPVKTENGKYYGARDGVTYLLQDDHAAIFAEYWEHLAGTGETAVTEMVTRICSDDRLWEKRLHDLPGFSATVAKILHRFLHQGVTQTAVIQ